MRRHKTFFLALIFQSILFIFCSRVFSKELPKLIFFYSATCKECAKLEHEFMPQLKKQFQDKIEIESRDINNLEGYQLLLGLKEQFGPKVQTDLPLIFFSGKFFSGQKQIENELVGLIEKTLRQPSGEEKASPVVDLVSRFLKFNPLAVISAGLIDGINPCAFTVIVFFISFLTLQGYKRKELVLIGLSFIFAVFVAYIFIGLGLFNFLYRLKGFWLATKALNISVGIFSIFLGTLAIYDFSKIKKTTHTEGLILQLPQALKNRIHYVIGLHYRKDKRKEPDQIKTGISRLIISALITGFMVSILEAICTGQVYLPIIVLVLKTTSLKLQALAYLLLYNIMFIVPLLVIFLFALLGTTSEQFSRFLKKHMASIKILMAVLFFTLGILLVWGA